MGVADVIPGVSGGTIAFITGIYEELVHSISTILAGVTTSLLLLSGTMLYLLKYYPVIIWSFFFGLVLTSGPLILRKIKKWRINSIAGLITGVGVAYIFTILSPTQSPDNLFFVFLSGAIAICAMVLPGISGVFILLLLGKYQYLITALNEFNLLVIFVFTVGCVLGLIGISRLLTRVLNDYNETTIAVLSGLMMGALNKVWPWRKVLEYATNSKGDQIAVFDKSILPWDYLSVTGKDPQLFQAIFMMALGVLIVVLIEKIAVRIKMKH